MRRRSLLIMVILLFLLFIGACQKEKKTASSSIDLVKDVDNLIEDTEESDYLEDTVSTGGDLDLEDTASTEGNLGLEDTASTETEPGEKDTPNHEIDLNEESIATVKKEGEITVVDEKLVFAKDILSTGSKDQIMETMRGFPAETRIDIEGAEKASLRNFFYAEELDDRVKKRVNGKSYGEDCTVPYETLRYIRVLHVGFDGETYIGELIMNKALVEDILDILWELYEMDYPIERMILVDEYDADDDKSMAANNSSSFNFRLVAGTTRLSQHSLGLAIDINPLQNPYITKLDGKEVVLPDNALEFVDRTLENPYYIHQGDACYEAFIRRGFTWGGEWKNSKDYQHFQKKIEEK